jgi:hypothetical protein
VKVVAHCVMMMMVDSSLEPEGIPNQSPLRRSLTTHTVCIVSAERLGAGPYNSRVGQEPSARLFDCDY